VVDGEAVLEAVGAPRVLGHVAADGADLLARRVRSVEVPLRCDGARDIEVRDARLDDDALGGDVDLEDPVHAGDGDDDAVRDRQRAARETGARASRDERHTVARAEPQRALDLVERSRKDYGRRLRAPSREAVAVVRREPLRLGEEVLAAHHGADVVEEPGREAHRGDPTRAALGASANYR
jgi:hypothetical protein